ncbi:MAG: class I SAM-dependent methyltransferase [Planctomycetota bacterium]
MSSTMSKKKPATKKVKKKSGTPMAATADRHVCYQKSVQCVEAEIDFVDETFKELRGRNATLLREDFCGTANTSSEWVKRRRTNRAIGVDLDGPTLDWGRENNIAALTEAQRGRLTLLQENVLTVDAEPVDCVLAMNFSYFIFQERAQMIAYYKSVRESLVDGGIFFLDCFGGYESFKECTDEREIDDDLTYVWDQHRYDPISGEMDCFIHFHFADGSKMRKAFTYTWRMWTLPEIREMLTEAGFKNVTVYWEGTEEGTDEGDGNFEPVEEGDADPAWICYVVAEK